MPPARGRPRGSIARDDNVAAVSVAASKSRAGAAASRRVSPRAGAAASRRVSPSSRASPTISEKNVLSRRGRRLERGARAGAAASSASPRPKRKTKTTPPARSSPASAYSESDIGEEPGDRQVTLKAGAAARAGAKAGAAASPRPWPKAAMLRPESRLSVPGAIRVGPGTRPQRRPSKPP